MEHNPAVNGDRQALVRYARRTAAVALCLLGLVPRVWMPTLQAAQSAERDAQPNIVLILADDNDNSEQHCFGNGAQFC